MSDQKVGLTTAIALVVANMVGTGVFSSLGFQVGLIPSVSALIFLWLCGGIIALCGGLSYIQLAKLYPDSGGEYHFVGQVYPRIFSYFVGFVSIFAGFAAPVALAGMAFSHYFSQVYSTSSIKGTAFILISIITLFHCISVRLGSGFQLVTTAAKLLVILFFIAFGIRSGVNANTITFSQMDFDAVISSDFARCLVYVSFAYSGWNACIYIFHEIRNPQVNIPKSVIIGTLLVTLMYLLLNFIFLKTVPMDQLNNVVEVGAVSANVIFGKSAGEIMALFISILLVSSISAMIWVGSRVIAKMISKVKILKLSKADSKIPLEAILIQYLITTSLLLTESFQQILLYTGVLLSVSSCLTVAILYFNYRKLKNVQFIAPTIFVLSNIYTVIVLLR